MEDREEPGWQERCDRYFTSLTDSDKQRQRERKTDKKCSKNSWKNVETSENEICDGSSWKDKVQYWFRALDVHGIHFAGSVRNNLECLVWIFITVIAIGAFSFLLFLVVSSFLNQENKFQIKTVSSVRNNHPKTFIKICNLNLLKSSSLTSFHQNSFSPLVSINSGIFTPQPAQSSETLMRKTELWSVMQKVFSKGALSFAAELDQEFFPYSGMSSPQDWSSLYGASMTHGYDIWKDAVQPTVSELKLFGHRASDMLVQCVQGNSGVCQQSVIEDTQPGLGNCATFNVSENVDRVSLILNTEPSEVVPILTPSNGMSIQIYPTESYSYGTFHHVSPGNHLMTRNKKTSTVYRTSECSTVVDYSPQQCENNCIDILSFKYCQCHTDGVQNNQCKINNKFQFVCSRTIKKLYKMDALECKCQEKCSETKYQTYSTNLPWPSEQHLDFLELSLRSKHFNRSTIKTDLVYVTIDLVPETVEELIEKQSITLLDLLSMVGGLSALMVGMSIVTVFQFVWLFVKLCFHTVLPKNSDTSVPEEKLGDSEITSITWQAYKNNNSADNRPQRFSSLPELGNGLQRTNSRRSYLEPIEEERKQERATNNHDPLIVEDQLFSHPWERTGQRRPYVSTIINSNRSGGTEFPFFNYIDSRSNSPLPRCSTPDNSDYRSTARLVPADGDVRLYPPRSKGMSPADAIKAYGTPSPAKYHFNGPFYL